MTEIRKLNDTYTILEELGTGGGGVVYKAYHERLKTYVVVKKIRERVKGILDSRAEVDILKSMKHTYLPRVYDFLEIDGDIYTVIDYIPGESLDRIIKKHGPFSQKEVLNWANELAEALNYLHSQKPPAIHSDIKPANIMLTPEGHICLIDFNISLALDSHMKNSTGISAGYSPPEQYRDLSFYNNMTESKTPCGQQSGNPYDGRTITLTETLRDGKTTEASTSETVSLLKTTIGKGVDMRSDIYALGATLYHLLTGIHPSSDFSQIIPIDECGIDISEGFCHILKKMMALNPEERYQSGSELLDAFRHIQELDSEYQGWRRTQRLKAFGICGLLFGGALLTFVGKNLIQKEKNLQYNELMVQSEEAVTAGNFQDASRMLEEAETIFPEKAEAYSKEIWLLYEQEKYDDCIQYAEQVLRDAEYTFSGEESANTLGDIYYILGNAYLEKDDYSNAVLSLEKAVADGEKNSLYYRDYAIALAKTGKIDQAEEELNKAIELELGEDSIYMVQGEISFAKGNYTDSIALLQKAISCAETDSLRKRAVLLCDKNYREFGNDYLNQEIEMLETEENRYADSSISSGSLSERLADAYIRKSNTAEGEKQTYQEKALDKFRSLYESGYTTGQMMENIAILYEQLDEYDQAEAMLLQMADKYPDSYIPYKRLAFLEADRQQQKANADREYQTMKRYYETALKLYDESNSDQEMQMLAAMIQELQQGNWF